MKRHSKWLVMPVLAALAVGTGALVAPDVARAQCIDTDADTICDLDDPCPTFANTLPLNGGVNCGTSTPDPNADCNGDGIPNECQCGDINLNGLIDSQDAVFAFNCKSPPNLPPSVCDPPAAAGIGDANWPDFPGYDTQDAIFIFNAQPGKNFPPSFLTCPSRPPPFGIGNHKCVLDPTSGITLFAQLGAVPLGISGSADVNCGAVDSSTGKAECSCNIQELDPIPIFSVGLVCISPAPGCDFGEIDCDGGNALDLEVRSDHDLGACRAPGGVTGHLGCEIRCQNHCAGLGLDFFNSGCEGFCTEPPHSECEFDITCADLGEGSCAGEDAPFVGAGVPHAGACGCHCVGIDGSPSRAGGLLCNVGADLKVVTASCDEDPLIDVGVACIPVTTETVTNLLEHANNGPNEIPCIGTCSVTTSMECFADDDCPTGQCSVTTSIPCHADEDCPMGESCPAGETCAPLPGDCVPGTGGFTEIGIPGDCDLLAVSTTTGASLRGAVNFFDSTLGDLAVSINFTCE